MTAPVLTVVPPVANEPDEYVLMALHSMLKLAMDGTITAIAIAGVGRDGVTATNYAANRQSVALMGALQVAQTRVMNEYLGGQ
jgi:hypothetical protein